MSGRLEEKVVLVTGSTTGIGEATARLCVAEGAYVMVHGRNEDRAKALSDDLGERANFVIADLAEAESAAEIVGAAIEQFGTINAVVNNAAVTTRSTLAQTDADLFDWIIAINLRAPLLIIREAMKWFKENGGGAVLNVGSVNALAGQPDLVPYSVSKGGMATLTRNLANGLAAERIRVNQLNVGWVTSPNEIALKQTEGMKPGWETRVPVEYAPTGRLLIPEEVARHILFWISDDSAPANGCVYELEQYSLIGRNATKAFS